MNHYANPKLYRSLLEPRPTAEVEADMAKFVEELHALREKYRIPDLYLVAQLPLLNRDGAESQVNLVLHFGDQTNRESLAAWAYGHVSAQRQQTIGEIVKSSAAVRAQK